MSRYIDVDKLIAEIENMNNVDYGSFMDYDVHRGAGYMKHDVLAVIDEQPTTEIVRCKDCMWYNVFKDDYNRCQRINLTRGGEQFCSYGERKGGAE